MALKVGEHGASIAASTRASFHAIGYNRFVALFGFLVPSLKPIRAINMSFGGLAEGPAPMARAAIAAANSERILVVAAAGNAHPTIAGGAAINVDTLPGGQAFTPCQTNPQLAAYNALRAFFGLPPVPLAANLMCVAASNHSDQPAGFSYWGHVSVDLAAPGASVHSLSATHDIFMNIYGHPGGAPFTAGAGDTRLRAVTTQGAAFAAGSVVGPAHPDVGSRLLAVPADVRHDEFVPANGIYDVGECIYRDVAPVGTVSPGDTRFTPCAGLGPGTIVTPGNPDVGNDLVPFVATEMRTSTRWDSGTSFAAPQVVGIAALCWSIPDFAGLSAEQMKGLIKRSVDSKSGCPEAG